MRSASRGRRSRARSRRSISIRSTPTTPSLPLLRPQHETHGRRSVVLVCPAGEDVEARKIWQRGVEVGLVLRVEALEEADQRLEVEQRADREVIAERFGGRAE